MMTILAVEDEPPLLRDLVQTIESAGHGWKVVATARDGAEALASLRAKEPPDLVITDIRMPGMDGLQLAEAIQKEFRNLPVLLLSGFREFEYARRAVSLGIREYLLKPYSTESLVGALDRTEKAVVKERKDLLQRRLENALYGSSASGENDAPKPIGLMTLIAGNVTDPSCPAFLAGSNVWDNLDLDAIVSDSLQDTVFWILEGWNSAEQVVVWDPASIPADLAPGAALESMADRLSNGIASVTLIAERGVIQSSDLKGVYRAHRKLAAERCKPGVSAFLWNDPQAETAAENTPLHITGAQEYLLSRALAEGNGDMLAGILSAIVKDWIAVDITQKTAKKSVELLMSKYVEDFDRDMIEDLFASSKDLPALIPLWVPLFPEQQAREPAGGAGITGDLILAAQQYLRKNFTKSITGEELAKKIGIGSSYLSKLFKEKIGLSPPEYLIHLRMEEAKRLLSSGSALMVKEIAEAVGYTDPGHFSRIFKKNFGVWPTEFKG